MDSKQYQPIEIEINKKGLPWILAEFLNNHSLNTILSSVVRLSTACANDLFNDIKKHNKDYNINNGFTQINDICVEFLEKKIFCYLNAIVLVLQKSNTNNIMMKQPKSIIKSYRNLINYIQKNWPEQEIQNFKYIFGMNALLYKQFATYNFEIYELFLQPGVTVLKYVQKLSQYTDNMLKQLETTFLDYYEYVITPDILLKLPNLKDKNDMKNLFIDLFCQHLPLDLLLQYLVHVITLNINILKDEEYVSDEMIEKYIPAFLLSHKKIGKDIKELITKCRDKFKTLHTKVQNIKKELNIQPPNAICTLPEVSRLLLSICTKLQNHQQIIHLRALFSNNEALVLSDASILNGLWKFLKQSLMIFRLVNNFILILKNNPLITNHKKVTDADFQNWQSEIFKELDSSFSIDDHFTQEDRKEIYLISQNMIKNHKIHIEELFKPQYLTRNDIDIDSENNITQLLAQLNDELKKKQNFIKNDGDFMQKQYSANILQELQTISNEALLQNQNIANIIAEINIIILKQHNNQNNKIAYLL